MPSRNVYHKHSIIKSVHLFRKDGRILHAGKRECPSLSQSVKGDLQKQSPFELDLVRYKTEQRGVTGYPRQREKECTKAWSKRCGLRKVTSLESLE